MFEYNQNDVNSIYHFSKKLEGKTLRDVLSDFKIKEIEYKEVNDEKFNRNKGRFGSLVQSEFFGLSKDSNKGPDFSAAGLELKVTSLKISQKGVLVPKERLSLCTLNCHQMAKERWENSYFLNKISSTLLIRYVDPNYPQSPKIKKDGSITYHKNYSNGFTKELPMTLKKTSILDYKFVDVRIMNLKDTSGYNELKNDWLHIFNMIHEGKAHEFSEKQTTYLSANTKGAGGSQTTTQPFSNNIFKPRGLGLKPSFMKQFIDEKVYETWLKD